MNVYSMVSLDIYFLINTKILKLLICGVEFQRCGLFYDYFCTYFRFFFYLELNCDKQPSHVVLSFLEENMCLSLLFPIDLFTNK